LECEFVGLTPNQQPGGPRATFHLTLLLYLSSFGDPSRSVCSR
jgi:hypothetical protein